MTGLDLIGVTLEEEVWLSFTRLVGESTVLPAWYWSTDGAEQAERETCGTVA